MPRHVRVGALIAPVLLFLYGVLRLVDGLDGDHGHGLAWNVGHTLFFVAFVLFGGLTVGLRQVVAPAAARTRAVANVATAAGLLGAACFVWVTLGDLFADLHDAAPLPDPLELVGPLLFQVGVLALLVVLVTGHPRRLPVWSPLLVLAGFLLFAVNLDLIPIGALLVLAGLAPIAVPGTNAGDIPRAEPVEKSRSRP
jgi:hypothetical protein